MRLSVFILTIALLFSVLKVNSQSLVVKSFRKMDATRIESTLSKANKPTRSKVTLIKVLTDQLGFVFTFNPNKSIIATEQYNGVQMYLIPIGAKSVTITNKQLGVECTYSFGTELEEWIYEMALKIDGAKSGGNDQLNTQWVIIKSIPTSAKIFIDDYAAGFTPYSGSLTIGSHRVNIESFGKTAEKTIDIVQGKNPTIKMTLETPDYKIMEPIINETDDRLPEYKGGMKALLKFLKDNAQYPSSARESGIQGTVTMQFTIGETGKVSDVKVLKGIGGGCDEEAIRLTKMMQNWKPAQSKGKAVQCTLEIPVKFQLP